MNMRAWLPWVPWLGVLLLAGVAMPWHRPWPWSTFEWVWATIVLLFGSMPLLLLWRMKRRLARFEQTRAVRQERAMIEASVTGVGNLSPEARQRRDHMRKTQLEDRLGAIVASLRRFIGAHAAVCYLADEKGEHLLLNSADAVDDSEFERQVANNDNLLAWVFKHSQPFVAMELKPVSGLTYYRRAQEMRSFLAVPILQDESCIGVLAVDSREVQAFAEEEYRYILDVMAQQIVDWIKMADNESESQEELEHWRAFFSAAQHLQAVNDYSTAVSYALDQVGQVVNADMIALCERVPGQRSFVIRGLSGTFGAEAEGQAFSADESWAGWALEQASPRHIPDLSRRKINMPLLCNEDGVPGQGSALCIPFDPNRNSETDTGADGGLILWSYRIGEFNVAEISILSRLMAPFVLAFGRVRATEALRRMATRDALTGLYNRRVANRSLEKEMQRSARNQVPLSIVLFDIDHFKSVNDTHGHDIGDEVLKNVAAVMKRSVREIDIPARFGGEEFLAILPQTDTEGAVRTAERIRKELKKSRTPLPKDNYLQVTASFGVATLNTDQEESINSILKRADEALYVAKSGGRDRVQVASSEPIETVI